MSSGRHTQSGDDGSAATSTPRWVIGRSTSYTHVPSTPLNSGSSTVASSCNSATAIACTASACSTSPIAPPDGLGA